MSFRVVDPREAETSFLVRVDQLAVVVERRASGRRRLQGELEFVPVRILKGGAALVELYRLSLFASDPPGPPPLTSGLYLSATEGRGVLRPTNSDGTAWSLEFRDVVVKASYDRPRSLKHRGGAGDTVASPWLAFKLTMAAQLRSRALAEMTPGLDGDRAGTPDQSLVIDQASLEVSRRADWVEGGDFGDEEDLVAVSLGLLNVPVFAMGAVRNTLKRIPLRAVVFPLDKKKKKWTGGSWQRQLDGANEVWRDKCCIEFLDKGVQQVPKVKLATSLSSGPVTRSWNSDDFIEIYFVESGIGAQSDRLGHPRAWALIPEPNDTNDYALAHELGHVMRGCEPNERCADPQWPGSPGSVLEVGWPNPSKNSSHNCRNARQHTPLATTVGTACQGKPDF